MTQHLVTCLTMGAIVLLAPWSAVAQEEVTGTQAKIEALLQMEATPDVTLHEVERSTPPGSYTKLPSLLTRPLSEDAPTLRDAQLIGPIRQVVEAPRSTLRFRAIYGIALAKWLHGQGHSPVAQEVLQDLFGVLQSAFQDREAPRTFGTWGGNVRTGDRLVAAMIEVGSSDQAIQDAYDLIGPPFGSYSTWTGPHPEFSLAVEKERHAIVRYIIDQQATDESRRSALSAAALAYLQAGDIERGLPLVNEAFQVAKQIRPHDLNNGRPNWDTRLLIVLAKLEQRALVFELMEHQWSLRPEPYVAANYAGICLLMQEAEAAERWLTRYDELPPPSGDYRGKTYHLPEYFAEIRKKKSIAWVFLVAGHHEKSIQWAEKIAPDARERYQALQWVGADLLKENTPESKQMARTALERNAPLLKNLPELADEDKRGLVWSPVFTFSRQLASLGGQEVVDKEIVPAIPTEWLPHFHATLAPFYTDLPLDEKLARRLAPDARPDSRIATLQAILAETTDPDEAERLRAMLSPALPVEHQVAAANLVEAAREEHQAGDWEESRKLWEESLAHAQQIPDLDDRLYQIDQTMAEVWVHGHVDLAQAAARTLIDQLWEVRNDPAFETAPWVRRQYTEDAQLLLETLAGRR